jgi:murein L,D-transpeptidase YcbB/YkuD
LTNRPTRRAAPLLLSLLLAVFVTAGCRSETSNASEIEQGDVAETWDPRGLLEVRNIKMPQLREAIAEVLGADRPEGLDERDWKRVHALYANYDTIALWLEKDADSERADDLIAALLTIHEHGLRGDLYPLEELRAALAPIDKARRPSAEQLAKADVMLSAMYVALGEDLLTGQIDPRSVEQQWRLDAQAIDVDSALARTLRMEPLRNAIARMRPTDPAYHALQKSLTHYRGLLDRGGWQPVPEGETLSPGDTTSLERLTALRRRLAIEDLVEVRTADTARQAANDSASREGPLAVYDAKLAGAVAEFQRRHGIVVDSILGPGTLASLNVPVEYRVGQIMANLERFRWLPRELGDRYVYVNVPAFRLDAYDNGERVLEMPVIVGAEYEDRATPAFSDSMSYLEFAPYWNVPQNIAENELWPKQEADPTYFARNNYETLQRGGETWIRQKPGDKNALGEVKFMFPNQFDIYLHDTPERSLFTRDVRAFSHGCIRVGDPAKLAEYALAYNDGWDMARIRSAMNGENRQVPLERKIPVYIVYFTTFVRDGDLYFGNDIYDRDSELVNLVKESAVPTPEVERLLAELRKLVD